ncbi:hypothetical protein Tco_1550304 [Tanacetum coccineum]
MLCTWGSRGEYLRLMVCFDVITSADSDNAIESDDERNHRRGVSVTNLSETTVTDGFPTEKAVAIDLLCSSVRNDVTKT